MNIYPLDLNFQGVPQTIVAYLVVGPEGPVLVETGPALTLPTLQACLAAHGYDPADIRHVLVSHIHLDHAGAAGWWAQQGACVYVHHVGAPHLVDPSRLLSSAQRIYGEMMDPLWGQTSPAPAEHVRPLQGGETLELGGLRFTVLDTPGHAWHHLVFRLNGVAFTGDVAGVRLPGQRFLSLPAPPPEFHLERWQETLRRLLDADLETLYLTHFGAVENVREHLLALSDLIDQAAEFVRVRVVDGVEREALLEQYMTWTRERAAACAVTERAFHQYETANPTFMSVDGLARYWRKRLEHA